MVDLKYMVDVDGRTNIWWVHGVDFGYDNNSGKIE